jgi:PAS domain S-box-containing protein
MNAPSDDPASAAGTATLRQLALLVDAVEDYAIMLMDREGHITSWNAGAQRIKGWKADEIIGHHFSRFYTPEDVARNHPQDELFAASREGRFEEEGWRVRKDGSRLWANVTITSIRDEDGQLLGYGEVTRDLTVRRLAEEELRASAAELASANVVLSEFRLLVSTVSDYGIFMLDPGGHVATWNVGAETIKGWTAEEIVGRHFSAFYTDEDRARKHPEEELEVAARDGRCEDEGWRVRKDGSRFWANVVITALRNEQGTLVGFAKVTRDLTERRMASEQLRAQAEQLAAFNDELQDIAAAMAHDLTVPLSTIGGFAAVLAGERHAAGLDDQGRLAVAQVQGEAQRMQRLLDGLLEYLQAGSANLPFGPVDLAAAVAAVVESLGPALSESGAQLTVDSVPTVTGNRGLLESVFHNLIANALRYPGADAPRVAVRCEERDGTYRVSVEDNGPGIPAEDRERVFLRFQRGRVHADEQPSGSGLGLAIAKRIVERHGGTLTIEDSSLGGAALVVTLPVPSA